MAAEGSPSVSGPLLISSHTVTSPNKILDVWLQVVTASWRMWTHTIGLCIFSPPTLSPNQTQLPEEGAVAGGGGTWRECPQCSSCRPVRGDGEWGERAPLPPILAPTSMSLPVPAYTCQTQVSFSPSLKVKSIRGEAAWHLSERLEHSPLHPSAAQVWRVGRACRDCWVPPGSWPAGLPGACL